MKNFIIKGANAVTEILVDKVLDFLGQIVGKSYLETLLNKHNNWSEELISGLTTDPIWHELTSLANKIQLKEKSLFKIGDNIPHIDVADKICKHHSDKCGHPLAQDTNGCKCCKLYVAGASGYCDCCSEIYKPSGEPKPTIDFKTLSFTVTEIK